MYTNNRNCAYTSFYSRIRTFVEKQIFTYTNINSFVYERKFVRIRTTLSVYKQFTCLYTNIFVFVYKPKITYTTQKLFVYEHINFHHLNKFCPCKDLQLFVYEQIRVCIRTILNVYKHYEGSYTNTLLFIYKRKSTYTNNLCSYENTDIFFKSYNLEKILSV